MDTLAPLKMSDDSLDPINHIISYLTHPSKFTSNNDLSHQNTAVPHEEESPTLFRRFPETINQQLSWTDVALVATNTKTVKNPDKLCLYISRIFSLKGLVDLDSFDDDRKPGCTYTETTESEGSVPKFLKRATPGVRTPIAVTRTSITDNVVNITPLSLLSPDDTPKMNTHIPVFVRPHVNIPAHSEMRTSPLSGGPLSQPAKYGEPPHSGPRKEFQCEICGYRFSQKGNLVTHLRIHKNLRPFQCDECGYAARQLVQLKRHAKHHTFRFLYKCRFCSYSSMMKSTTTKHCMLVHAELFKALNIDRFK